MDTGLLCRTVFFSALLVLSGCAAGSMDDPIARVPAPVQATFGGLDLDTLAPPKNKISLAVYNIVDKTGQRKAHDSISLVSTAVTQGADSILVDILSRTGDGSWFRIMERNGIRNLLQERKIAELNLKRSHDHYIARRRRTLHKKLGWTNRQIAYQAVQELDDKENVRSGQGRLDLENAIKENGFRAGNGHAAIAQASGEEKRRQRAFDRQREKQLVEMAQIQGIDVNDIIGLQQQRQNLDRAKVIKAKLDKSYGNEMSRRSKVAAAIRQSKVQHRNEMGQKASVLDRLNVEKKQLAQKAIATRKMVSAEKKRHLGAVKVWRKEQARLASLERKTRARAGNAKKIEGYRLQSGKAYRTEMARRATFDAQLKKARLSHKARVDGYLKQTKGLGASVNDVMARKSSVIKQLNLLKQQLILATKGIKKAGAEESMRRKQFDASQARGKEKVRATANNMTQARKNSLSEKNRGLARIRIQVAKMHKAEQQKTARFSQAVQKQRTGLRQKQVLNAKKLKGLGALDSKNRKYRTALAKAKKDEKKRQAAFDKLYKDKTAEIRKLRKNANIALSLDRKKKLTKSQVQQVSGLEVKMDIAYRNEMARRAKAISGIRNAKHNHNVQLLQRKKQLKALRLKERLKKIQARSGESVIKAKEMRRRIRTELELLKHEKPRMLRKMIVADYIIEGAIVGYDSNEKTEGMGGRFVAIGGDKKYRQDIVTVALRLVDVKTGEILAAASSTKTIYSIALQGGTYKFVTFNRILEIEAGITRNEPPTLAVRQALEHSVIKLIEKGLERKYWKFRDHGAEIKYSALARDNRALAQDNIVCSAELGIDCF